MKHFKHQNISHLKIYILALELEMQLRAEYITIFFECFIDAKKKKSNQKFRLFISKLVLCGNRLFKIQ